MRSDLTPAFQAAKNANFRRPRQLLVFHFARGPVYISDQKISLGGIDYQPLVEEWGRLDTAGDSEQDTAEIREMALVLWNGGDNPFSDHFLIENPENVEVDLYQWFAGLADSDKALIDRFVIQDPINYGEASRLVTLDLVSLGKRYDAPIGDVLSKDDFPFALDSDINKGIDLIVGAPGQVTTLCARTAPQATMTGSILLLPTIINVHEDLDALGFAESGKVQIDEEILEFESRDADTLTISARGTDGTTAAEHSDGATVVEYITDHTYLAGREVGEINDIMVGDKPAKAGTYSVDTVSDPARIIFSSKPSYTDFSKGARSENVDFDATADANNAAQAYYSYDEDQKSNGALLSKDYTPLAVLQTDIAPDDGEVVRAFLSVEHWATDIYLNDHVEVWVDGLGVVGTLSRPNESDASSSNGTVDLDHGHGHATGENHTHSSVDPDFTNTDPVHDHPLLQTKSWFAPSDPDSYYDGFSSGGSSTQSGYQYYPFPTTPKHVQSAKYTLKISCPSETNGWITEIQVQEQYYLNGWRNGVSYTTYDNIDSDDGIRTITLYKNDGWDYSQYASPPSRRLKITVFLSVGSGGGHVYYQLSDILLQAEEVQQPTGDSTTGVVTLKSTSGSVTGIEQNTSVIKASDDVEALSEADRILQIVTSSSSRSITQKFDLTKHLESISWEWFVGREVQLRYVGSTNEVDIIVTYLYFEVEYRQRETIFTNEVTCSPVGTVGNRPDQIIEHLLGNMAGLPSSGMLLADAGTRFAELGYQLDGVFPASLSVRGAIKKTCQQTRSRLIWEAGKAKLVVREKFDNWSSVKSLLPTDLQQKSIQVRRQSLSDVVNDINLFYQKDHSLESDDQTAYLATAKDSDQDSIAKHGVRRDDDRFCFDLVSSQAMAESLADFYIWLLGEPSSFFEFTGYLPQIDLEKEDVIKLTSQQGFGQIVRRPVVIRAVDRIFGSAKNQAINLCRILVESIRHRTIEITSEDMIVIADNLGIEMDKEVSVDDPMVFADILTVFMTSTLEDDCSFSDELTTIFNVEKTIEETLSFADDLRTEIEFTTEEQITVSDEAFVAHEKGFGSGGFGQLPFGSIINHVGSATDDAGVSDIMTTEQTTGNEDEFSMGDELLTTSGFGSPLGDGFGLVPFGT